MCAYFTDDPGFAGGSPGTGQFGVREAAAQLPTLTVGDAKRYASIALKRKLGASFTKRATPSVFRTCQRLSRTKVRCSVSWSGRRYSFKGSVGIYFALQNNRTWWFYEYALQRTDLACLKSGKPQSACSTKLVVK